MATSIELGQELKRKQGEFSEFVSKNSTPKEGKPAFHWDAVKSNDEKSASEVGIEELNKRNTELAELHDKFTEARKMEDMVSKNEESIKAMGEVQRRQFSDAQNPDLMGREENAPQAIKSLGEMFLESAEYKANADKSPGVLNQWAVEIPQGSMAIKANSYSPAGGSGVLPYAQPGRYVQFAARRPVLRSLLSVQDSSANGQAYATVQFIRENTQTFNADIVAEGDLKPESELGNERITLNLEAIAHRIKVPNQALIFIPGTSERINQKGAFGVQLAEEDKMLNYNGTAGWKGFLQQTGVQSSAVGGAEDAFTAFHRGATLIETGGAGGAGSQASISGFSIHPNDWHEIITLKDDVGRFIYGDPAQQTPDVRLWGVPGVKTVVQPEGTVLMGDFAMYAVWWVAGGIRVIVGYENDDLSRNQQTIVVEEYAALEIDRPAAFLKMSGF